MARGSSKWSAKEIADARALVGRYDNDLSKEDSERALDLLDKALLDGVSGGIFRGTMWIWSRDAAKAGIKRISPLPTNVTAGGSPGPSLWTTRE